MEFQQQIRHLKERGLFRELKDVEQMKTKYLYTQNQRMINFTSNDYLGIAQAPIDLESLSADLNTYGNQLSSSRLVSGNTELYAQIESMISRYFGFEAALITNSGYDANLAVFNVLKGEDVMVFSDAMNHASIIDGIRLSRLNKVIYPHLDYDALEIQLRQQTDITKVIVTDTVFSTDGSMADLKCLKQLKQHYPDTLLIVDDSHGMGLGLNQDYSGVDVITSSLSKAAGAFGGLIVAAEEFKTMLVNKGRPVIYSSGLPTMNLHLIYHNFQRMIEADEKRAYLLKLSRYFNTSFCEQFYQQQYSEAPIKEITFQDNNTASKAYRYLSDNDIFVSYFRYPTVSHPALRISLNTFHSEADIDQVLKMVREGI